MKRQSKAEEALSRELKLLLQDILMREHEEILLKREIEIKRGFVRRLESQIELMKEVREKASVERRPRG